MKPALLVLSAALVLSACADDYYGYGGGYGAYGIGDNGYTGYGYPNYGYNGYGSYPGTVYYDGYYAPYASGYWGGNGYYYYRPGYGRPYLHDHRSHYRRDWAQGYRGYGYRGYGYRGYGGYGGRRGDGSGRGGDHHHGYDGDHR